MGDILDVSLSDKRPFQFIPILNVQADFEKHSKELYDLTGVGVSLYLQAITIYLNSASSEEGQSLYDYSYQITFPCRGYDGEISPDRLLPFVYRAVETGVKLIEIVCGNLFDYSGYKDLVGFIVSTNTQFILGCDYKNVTEKNLEEIRGTNIPFYIYVDSGFRAEKISRLMELAVSRPMLHRFIFAIGNEEDYIRATGLAEKYPGAVYDIRPVFTGGNMDFFKKSVFMNETNIFERPVSMQEIFARQKLNTNFFGKLIVTPDGKIYGNLNDNPSGTIEESLAELAYREFTKGNNWRFIRDKEPCSRCLYQFLCPSPSGYEQVLKKPNLCHIR